ncbi:Response regulator/GGDEF domain protein [Chitinispirillum alkaliphilum]|nr:Response regulator/GGDEF domain protein [Chitinispirillum alkaliphilum]
MKIKPTLFLIHYIAALAIVAISSLGQFDYLLPDTILFSAALLATSFLGLVSLFVTSTRKPLQNVGSQWFVTLFALVFLAAQASSGNEIVDAAYIPMLFALVASASLLNKNGAWFQVTMVFVMAEAWEMYLQISAATSVSLTSLLSGVPVLAALSAAGLIPELQKRKTAALEMKERRLKWREENKKPPEASKTEEPSGKGAFGNTEGPGNKDNAMNEQLSSVVFFISRNFKAYNTLLFIYDSAERVFKLSTFQAKSIAINPNAKLSLGDGVFGALGTTKHVFMSGDMTLYRSDLFYYSQYEMVKSVLAVSIMSQEGELLGFILLDSVDSNAFKDHDKELLKRFSNIAAALITNVRMRFFQQQAASTFQVFYEASHQFINALKTDDVFDVLFKVIPQVAQSSRLTLALYDEPRGKIVIDRVVGESVGLSQGVEYPLNAGLFSFAALKKKNVKISDMLLYKDRYYRFSPDEPVDNRLRSLIVIPVVDDKKDCVGLFSVESDKPGLFTDELEQVLSTIVENASVAYIRAVLYKKMEMLATTDGLTGLNNHRNFQDILSREIERSNRNGHNISLLLMDIDHFKSFNDTYGHPVGDLVLKEISKTIKASIRVNDFPARYGGEEFAVIITETDKKGALVTAERIRKSIEQKVIVSGEDKLKVTVSIGCAHLHENCSNQKQLIDGADKALYFSKQNGRNRITPFSADMSI